VDDRADNIEGAARVGLRTLPEARTPRPVAGLVLSDALAAWSPTWAILF